MRTFTNKFLAAFVLALVAFSTNAQVSTLYTFSSFQGSYTAITGGTAFSTSSMDDEDIVDLTSTPVINVTTGSQGAGLNIGFNFLYDNIIYDRFALSNNGFITLGQSALGNSAVNTAIVNWNHPISTGSSASATLQHKISPLGTDLLGKTGSEIRFQTFGTSPTRTTVIQWSNYQKFVAAPTGSDNINFQLKLYETSNIIDFIYGDVISVTLDSAAEVGLKGGSTADYNNRKVNATNTWSNSIAGTANNQRAQFSATLAPANGLVYRWSLPQCSSLSALTTTATSALVCPSKTVNVSLAPTFTLSGVSYSWTSSTNSATGPFTAMPNGSLPTQNNQTMTATTWYQLDALCITDNSSVTSSVYNVSVTPPPTVTAVASSASLCSGSSLTLTGVGSATAYAWAGGYPNGTGFNASTTTTFTVIGTGVAGCTTSAVVPVTVVPTPSLSPTASPTAMCIGNTSTLTATGATSYTWASGTQTVFTNTLTVTPNTTGISTYTISRDNQGCTNTQQITLITYPVPNVLAIANPTMVCAGKPTSLTVAGGVNYTWTSPGNPPSILSFTFGGPTPLAFPPVSTIYTVTAHDGTCATTTTVFVQANPNPTIITSASPSTLCSGGVATINGSGGLNYTIISSVTSNTYTSFPVTETVTGTGAAAFNVTGDNTFGCSTSTVQYIQIFANPSLSTTVTKTLVCDGGSVTLNATGANAYSWSSGANTSSALVNPSSSITGPVIYTVTGTFTASGCSSSKTVAVGVFIPTLTAYGNTATCAGGTISLIAGGGTGNNNYRWYTVPGAPATSSIAAINSTISGTTIFTLTGLTTSGTASLCPGTKTVEVNLYFNPTITATPQRSVICVNESVIITAGGGDVYLWSTGFDTNTISVNPKSTTNYTVTGTDTNGCVNTTTVQVKVSGCVSITEIGAANAGLNVYPNPSNGEFVIESTSSLKLTLVNDLGQLVRVIELSGANNHKIYVNDLARGIYFLSGQKDNVQINQKIIVSK
ncbi:hypothetical protein CNR22_14425 [Sphingobacteriaceae bacterium]|nr:hypothetical protein CNR22_14425 [Sphingobacteriaceae bacterium]